MDEAFGFLELRSVAVDICLSKIYKTAGPFFQIQKPPFWKDSAYDRYLEDFKKFKVKDISGVGSLELNCRIIAHFGKKLTPRVRARLEQAFRPRYLIITTPFKWLTLLRHYHYLYLNVNRHHRSPTSYKIYKINPVGFPF